MKNKFLLVPTLAITLFVIGCGSVLASLAAWAPVAITGFNTFVQIADPGSKLATDGNTIVSEFATLQTTVTAAEAAGAGLSGSQKVQAELEIIVAAIPTFESDAAASVNLSTTDKEYIAAGATIFETAATIYEAELTGTTAQLENIKGSCYGVNVQPDGSAKAWIDCTGDSSDALYASLDPVPNTNTTTPTSSKTTVKVTVKHAKVGNFKRQLNALARAYNHPEKQLKLTWAEHLHIK